MLLALHRAAPPIRFADDAGSVASRVSENSARGRRPSGSDIGRAHHQTLTSRESLDAMGLPSSTRRAECMTMWRMQGATGLVAGTLLFAAPVRGQELKAVGGIRSSGPVTSDASRKIGSHLRGLIADFQATGVVERGAATVDAATRLSSSLLQVDSTGRVQVYVSVTDIEALPL